MPNDYDSDSAVFFGADDIPDSPVFSFDPAADPTDDHISLGPDDSFDDADNDDTQLAVIRYGRFGPTSDEGPGDDLRDSVSRPGGSVPTREDVERERATEATNAGDRHIGRVADARAGSDSAGATGGSPGGRTARVADSLADAQRRIREGWQHGGPTVIGRVSEPTVESLPGGVTLKDVRLTNEDSELIAIPKRHYERSRRSTPLDFQQTNFEATLIGLKANVSGDWIVSFKVPPQYTEHVTKLASGYALGLDIDIKRRVRGVDE